MKKQNSGWYVLDPDENYDGENIDEATLPYLFDPYVKGVKGQFGLGLSIVSKISSMFQYSVTAKNHDVGVSFIFQKKK